ncbi:hypothetical protein D3C75_1258780 [compost metagenome]
MRGRCFAGGVADGEHDGGFAGGIRGLLLLQDLDLVGDITVGPSGCLGGEQCEEDDG